MKIKQKLSTIFTLFVYITSLFLSVASAVPVAHAAVDSSNVSLELKNTDAAGRTEYLTGEKISTSIHLGYTGDEPVSGVLRIKVKAEHLAVNSETDLFGKPHPLTTSPEWFKGQEDGYYYAEYTLSNVEGGSNIALPLGFSLKQGTTPQGFQTDVIAEVEIDGLEKMTRQLLFTSKIQPAKLYHHVENMSGGARARAVFDGKSTMQADVTYPRGTDPLPANTPNDDTTWARYIVGLDSSSNTYGNFTPQTATITYKMPVGSRLRGTGTYSGGGKDFTWTYDAGSHTATYTGPLTEAKTAYIELDFPDRPYADIHTSAASMVTDPGTVNQFDYAPVEDYVKWTPSVALAPPPRLPGSDGHFMHKTIRYDYLGGNASDNQGIFWQPSRDSRAAGGSHYTSNVLFVGMGPESASSKFTYVTEVAETELDDRLYFYEWRLTASGGNLFAEQIAEHGYKVYGYKASGEEVLIANDVRVLNSHLIDPETGQRDTEGKYRKLRFVFNQPIKMGKYNTNVWNNAMFLHIYTPVQPKIWNNWKVEDLVYADNRGSDTGAPGLESPHRMYSAGHFVTYFAGKDGEGATEPRPVVANQFQAITNVPYRRDGSGYPRVSTFYKATRTEVGSWTGEPQELVTSTGQPDDDFMIKGDVDVLNPNDTSRLTLKKPKLITLLPQGLEFVPGSETHGYAGKARVQDNYKGTGMTAVIIDFDDVAWDPTNNGNITETSANWHANKVERYVEFKVRPTEYLEYGDNLVKQYLIWDNNTDILPPADLTRTQKQPYADALDLDNDGDMTETFLEGVNKVIYNPPLGVTLRKYVSSDKNVWSPKVSELLDIDSEFFYKVTVSNRLGHQVDNVSVVDVLPFVGDKRIVANQRGAYLDRNSQFVAGLTNSVESIPENATFLAKWDVLYSTASQGATTDATVNASFVPAASITNWSDVKMVKFVMKPGTVLTASDVSEAILPFKVPNRTDLDLFAKANNTAAIKVPAIVDNYLEGSTVSAQVARYAVTGVAFHDTNKNGQKGRTEPVLSGYTVQLMNEDDTPVLDPVTGQEVTAVTDSKGVYKLDVFKRGRYYVKVLKKEAIETFTRLYEEGGQPKPGTSSAKDGVIGNDTSEIDTTAGRTAAFDLNPSVIPAGLESQTKAQQANTLATEDNTLLAVRNIGFDNVNVKLDITVTKSWDDANNQDGKRPSSIKVNLLANGTKVDTATISDNAGTWSHTFTEKPKYENGREIVYTVEEETVTGYTPAVIGTATAGFTITNSYTPEVVDVPVKKVWNDANNQDGKRPADLAVVVTKTVDGVTSDTAHTTTLTGAGNEWTHTFTGLPKYEAGKLITYGVKEVTVPAGYTSRVAGTTITNSYTPETTAVAGQKTWNDADNQDGKRPASITINLLADGVEVQEKVVTEAEAWAYEFTNLPKFKNAGTEIVYTITEDAVTGYTTEVNGFNVTNSYTPEVTQVAGTKTWDDADNQDGKRPASITVNLLADGVEVEEKVVTEAEAWAYEFTNLPKFKNGREIVYTITEDAVDLYSTSVTGFNITNTYSPEKVVVAGSKTWNDANDQDGKRPASITVNLYADGDKKDSKTVNAAANWSYEFTNLPRYKNGHEIVYTIDEEDVEHYTKAISGYNLTNSYTPETRSVSGTKTWNDADNQDGKRPTVITIRLLADGTEVASKQVSVNGAGEWTYEFTGLPVFAKGKKIAYTITEDEVAEYTTKIKDFDITNKHVPELVTIEGTKTWDDANDQDGKRPEFITARLFANGEEVADVKVDADADWKYAFKDVPKYQDGQEIVYTITEDEVEGYTTTIDGYNITNSYTPEVVTVSGKKVWKDEADQDGIRPDSITVNLLAYGKEVADVKVVADANDNWTYEFTNLPKYEGGKEIH